MLFDKSIKKYFNNLLLWLLLIVLFLGGIGAEWFNIAIYSGLVLSILLLINIRLTKGKINTPPHIELFLIFLFITFINLFWSIDKSKTLEYILLFSTGGFLWISFYNLKGNEIKKYVNTSLVVLGLLFAGLYFYGLLTSGLGVEKYISLYEYNSWFKDHNHIGDLWAAVLLLVLFFISSKPRNIFLWLSTVLGVYLLTISLLRSAYLSLFIGILYLYKSKKWSYRTSVFYKIALILLIEIFLLAALNKDLLTTRVFFLQSLSSIKKYPFGVGLGNFYIISLNSSRLGLFGIFKVSAVVHNVVLEVISGIGILALPFILWLFNVFIDSWHDRSKEGLVYRGLFILMTVNFLFDTTYFIPTMLWLWFIFLGLGMNLINNSRLSKY